MTRSISAEQPMTRKGVLLAGRTAIRPSLTLAPETLQFPVDKTCRPPGVRVPCLNEGNIWVWISLLGRIPLGARHTWNQTPSFFPTRLTGHRCVPFWSNVESRHSTGVQVFRRQAEDDSFLRLFGPCNGQDITPGQGPCPTTHGYP